MGKMTAEQFRARVSGALEELGVAGEVVVHQVAAEAAADASDESAVARWTADVRITARPDAAIALAVAEGLDEDRLGRELRAELRRALRMCPLCQRIGHVEKLRNAQGQQEACAVRCPACGDFEIDQSLIRELRSAWERADREVLDRLPAVSDATQRGTAARLTRENWKDVS
jgi:hypothetical protein